MLQRRFQGSTLQALLAVAAVVILLSNLIPKSCRCIRAPLTAAQTQIANFESVLDAFHDDCGRYPTTEEGLEAIIKNPDLAGWKRPYISGEIPLDPWGVEAYRYDLPDGRPHIVCAGPDGKFDTSDDIASGGAK